MKKLSVEFWAILVLAVAGIVVCIISGTVAGAAACAFIGAAGLIAFFRTNRKKQ